MWRWRVHPERECCVRQDEGRGRARLVGLGEDEAAEETGR